MPHRVWMCTMLLVIRETEIWTVGSLLGAVVLLAAIVAVAVALIRVTLRR